MNSLRISNENKIESLTNALAELECTVNNLKEDNRRKDMQLRQHQNDLASARSSHHQTNLELARLQEDVTVNASNEQDVPLVELLARIR